MVGQLSTRHVFSVARVQITLGYVHKTVAILLITQKTKSVQVNTTKNFTEGTNFIIIFKSIFLYVLCMESSIYYFYLALVCYNIVKHYLRQINIAYLSISFQVRTVFRHQFTSYVKNIVRIL